MTIEGQRIPVLDYGYVELIESWGHGKDGQADDERRADMEVGIIEAARQSTQGAFRGWDQDAKLLKYLYTHSHMTPFEFAGMTIEVQLPIFVCREWHRHRTMSYNEASARYAPLPDLYYKPNYQILAIRIASARNTHNIQAAAVKGSTHDTETATLFSNELSDLYEQAETLYQKALAAGVPKELARLVMPVGHYTKMRASTNLRNWLQFLDLRADPAAQWEIQQYAYAVEDLIRLTFPRTHQLWKSCASVENPQ